MLAFSLLVLMPIAISAQGRFWDLVYKVLNGDTTAGPDHDTTYVKSYRDDLVVSPVTANQTQYVTLSRKDQEELRFATNTPVEYGVALDYKWLTIEYTTSVAGLSSVDEDRGESITRGVGFGYTGRNWWFRNAIRISEGFYAEKPVLVTPEWQEGDAYPYRADLRTTAYFASLSRGFNGRRYSHIASLWQMERQKRSSGSLIAGANFWYTWTSGSASLVPLHEREQYALLDVYTVERSMLSITGGYTGTISLWGHGFINAMVVPGVGMQRQRIGKADGERYEPTWDLAFTCEARVGAGYVGDKWYLAISAHSYQTTGMVTPDVQMGNSIASGRVAFGWRFKNMRSLLPRLGL